MMVLLPKDRPEVKLRPTFMKPAKCGLHGIPPSAELRGAHYWAISRPRTEWPQKAANA